MGQLRERLKTTGLEGWIHGAVNGQQLYVFTYRDPEDFFTSAEFPLVTRSKKVEQSLRTLHRHDRVRVKGEFLELPAAQTHLLAGELVIVKRWDGGRELSPYAYKTALPRDLLRSGELIARVHTVAEEGRVLVLDYRDVVIPVVVSDPALTRGLYRGDLVRVRYEIQSRPDRPVHLRLNAKSGKPLEVLSRIQDQDGKKATIEGALTLFPQSPQIRFDVYALRVEDVQGNPLTYTLVNFESPETFARIREKLAAVWNAHTGTAVNGRNKLVNPKLRVRATGVLNVQSPQQANPQIILDGPDAVEISVRP